MARGAKATQVAPIMVATWALLSVACGQAASRPSESVMPSATARRSRDAQTVDTNSNGADPQTQPHDKNVEHGAPSGINHLYNDPDASVERLRGVLESPRREAFRLRHTITAALEITPGARIADVGAGTGIFLTPFLEAVGTDGFVYLVETSATLLKHLEQRVTEEEHPNVRVIRGKQDHVQLKRSSVDHVFICNAYHHFESPKAILRSIRIALKKRGTLTVVDYVKREGVSSDFVLRHVRSTKEEVIREITKAGFKYKEGKDIPQLKENYIVQFTRKGPRGRDCLKLRSRRQGGCAQP